MGDGEGPEEGSGLSIFLNAAPPPMAVLGKKGDGCAPDGVAVFDFRKEREMSGYRAVLRQYLAFLRVECRGTRLEKEGISSGVPVKLFRDVTIRN